MSSTWPARIVHLSGGLRALDSRNGRINVEIESEIPVFEFPAPNYPELYNFLRRLGMSVIGVDFLNEFTRRGAHARDWQTASPNGGFSALKEFRAWGEVRHAASKDKNHGLRSVASRCQTYIRLLQLRVLDISESYNAALRGWYLSGGHRGRLHGSGFLSIIDASVHAFLADAASFRDLLAEIVWSQIVARPTAVRKMSTFVAVAKDERHALVQSILADAGEQGWIGRLTYLRNNVIHVAPAGGLSPFHGFGVRFEPAGIRTDLEAPTLHYPLLDIDGQLPNVILEVDFDDESQLKCQLSDYWDYHQRSADGLLYLWKCFDQLLGLCNAIRDSGGFRREMLHLTDADIVSMDE